MITRVFPGKTNAYTADAKKRCKSVERLRKAGLL